MELLQIKYFCQAAEMQNISRAARLNRVPASGISSSIKRLEQELGVDLFFRYSNKIKLTEQGKFFYEEASRILESLDSIKNKIKQTDEPGGKITVRVLACENIVENSILEFQKKFPHISFDIFQNPTMATDADFYISDEMFYIRGCVKKILIEEKLMLVARKDNPLLQKENIVIKDLKSEKFVCTSLGTSIYHRVNSVCYDNGFVPDIVMTAPSPRQAIKFIENSDCIGVFPESEIAKSNALSVVELNCSKRRVCVFHEEGRLKPKANQLFLDSLLNYGSLIQKSLSD